MKQKYNTAYTNLTRAMAQARRHDQVRVCVPVSDLADVLENHYRMCLALRAIRKALGLKALD